MIAEDAIAADGQVSGTVVPGEIYPSANATSACRVVLTTVFALVTHPEL